MSTKQYYIYRVPPIDDFTGCLDMASMIANLDCARGVESIVNLLISSAAAAAKIGWEGDVRSGPYFFAVPNGAHGTQIGVIWKQDNNGTTFVASPIELRFDDADDDGIAQFYVVRVDMGNPAAMAARRIMGAQ